MDLQKLKFPIGEHISNKNPGRKEIDQWINNIETFPSKLSSLIDGKSIEKLNWKYRPNGWTIKQVIHHCADSHMNSFIRFKLALTEDTPKIRPYFEDKWAMLPDSLNDDINDSLNLLTALHSKWVFLLKQLNENQLKREFIHPESGSRYNLAGNIGIYAWHCNHHFANIENALASNGKYN